MSEAQEKRPDCELFSVWSRELQRELATHAGCPRDDDVIDELQFGFILRIVREYVPFVPTYSLHEISSDCGGREQLEHIKGPFAMSNRRVFRFDESRSRMETVFDVIVGAKRVEDFVVDPISGSAFVLSCDLKDELGSQIRCVSNGKDDSVLIGGLPYLSKITITPNGDVLLAACAHDGRILSWERDSSGKFVDSYPRRHLWTEPSAAVQHICASDDSLFVVGDGSHLYRISLKTGAVVRCLKTLGPFFGLHYSPELDILVYLDDFDPVVMYLPASDLDELDLSEALPDETAIKPHLFATLPDEVCMGWYRLSDCTSTKGEIRLAASVGLRSSALLRIKF